MKRPIRRALDPEWTGVYRTGGLCAIAAVVMVLLETAIILATGHFVTPYEAGAWFPMLNGGRAVGLIAKGVLDIAVALLLVPMYLALFHLLRQQNLVAAILGLAFACIGIASYLPMNQAIYLLHSSDLYNATTSSSDKAAYLIQGQAAVAIGRYGMFWSVGFLTQAIGGLVFSVAILRGKVLPRAIGCIGTVSALMLVANFVSFFFVPVDYGWTSTALASGGGVLSFLWWVLIGFQLLSMARSQPTKAKGAGRRAA